MATQIEKNALVAAPLVDATTTADILAVLGMADDGAIETTPEQMAELGERLASKIDANRYVQKEINTKLLEFGELKKQIDATIRALKGHKERQKSYLAHHLKTRGLQTIPGIAWKVRLTSDRRTRPRREAAPLDAVNYPDFVRVKYEWDLTAIAKALEMEDPLAKEVAQFEETHSIEFETYKGNLLESDSAKRAGKAAAKTATGEAGSGAGIRRALRAEQGPDREGFAGPHEAGPYAANRLNGVPQNPEAPGV